VCYQLRPDDSVTSAVAATGRHRQFFESNSEGFLGKNGLAASTAPKSAPNVKRERLDQLNTVWFTDPRQSLQLNLFSDAQYTAVVDRVEMIDHVSVFYCHIQDHEERPVILSYQSGALAARIPTPSNQVFQILSDGKRWHRIIELDETLPICGLGGDGSPGPLEAAGESASQNTAPPASPGQPAVVDVMVLYSTEAKNAYGGDTGINTTTALGLAYMNTAFNRSGINAKGALVYKSETTWHTQLSSDQTELDWLSADAMVAGLASQYGADLVTEITTLGGRAFCSGAFSVIDSDAHTFAHELGHNLGCNHNRTNATAGCNFYSYSYGYPFYAPSNGATFGTIMSYVGSALENYSSPLVYFGGAATGLPEGHLDAQGQPDSADNARTINQRASVVAAWKSTSITVLDSPALISSDTQFTFNITGPNNGTYTVEYTSDYLSWTFLGNYSLSAGSVAVTDNIGSTLNRFYRAKLGTNYLGTQVGFIKKSVPSGQSMIANQLDNVDNTVGWLLPGLPTGTILYKWDESVQQFVNNTYLGTQWSSPSMTLHPGEGAILSISEARTINFVGQVRDAVNIEIPKDQSIRSSPVPQAGAISSVLLFPGGSLGDQVSKMTDPSGSYTTFT